MKKINKDMSRDKIRKLKDIPNIGKAIEKKILLLGIREPDDLIGRDPYRMYIDLCDVTGKEHDPCILDVFISQRLEEESFLHCFRRIGIEPFREQVYERAA